jgi:hypothetical protein
MLGRAIPCGDRGRPFALARKWRSVLHDRIGDGAARTGQAASTALSQNEASQVHGRIFRLKVAGYSESRAAGECGVTATSEAAGRARRRLLCSRTEFPNLPGNLMARLPDRFDLWVRKARSEADPARQVDWVLGALVARKELFFLNGETKERPEIARASGVEAAVPSEMYAVVFTDAERLEDFVANRPTLRQKVDGDLPVIVSPTASALAWCVTNMTGLVINPNEGEMVQVSATALGPFVEEWKQRGGRQAAGFWIPNMTTAEEDFWQGHGL